ncbi:hypothetical protein AV530_019211 [Patagioenas fasciata monilis]|uniref:Uncharacterized protein n=1 Tax=Patagioenas fasciata monilis TaxID=372326 RepID=A0A1V4L0E7_PATFA|nr:hypothetical protein AV530_019211 [Patagioenas fasciata monilis]
MTMTTLSVSSAGLASTALMGFTGGTRSPCTRGERSKTHPLKVSPEEIYHGSTKKMKITCRRLIANGQTMWPEDKILNIVIKGVRRKEPKLHSPKKWTPFQTTSLLTSSSFSRTSSLAHRDGMNMVYTANISLKEVRISGKSHGVGGAAGSQHMESRKESVLVLC